MSDKELSVALELADDGMRLLRDEALAESDWTQLLDCALSSEDKAKWTAYREYLRDLPQTSDSNDILSFKGIVPFSEWSE